MAELNIMNTNDPSKAWVGTFVNNEFTSRDLGVNYSTAIQQSITDRNYTVLDDLPLNGSVDLWEYNEYRMDWTQEFIHFYIAGNLTRSIQREGYPGMPSIPAPFYFKHFSTGNSFSMQGPPDQRSVANIRWIRMFFNSSSSNEGNRKEVMKQCSLAGVCSTDDIALRGSSPYNVLATAKWKQKDNKSIKRMPALWISISCISVTSLLLLHALIRRAPWRKELSPKDRHGLVVESQSKSREANSLNCTTHSRNYSTSSIALPASQSSGSIMEPKIGSEREIGDDLTIELVDQSPQTSVWGGSTRGGLPHTDSLRFDSRATIPHLSSPYSSVLNVTGEDFSSPNKRSGNNQRNTLSKHSSESPMTNNALVGEDKVHMSTVTESALPAPRMAAHPPPPRERIDYLAGLVAMCAILVTVMHFGLTFIPAMIIPGAPVHYRTEYWAQQLISPIILNQMWLGVFFTTSVRFLVAGYLKRGDLEDIAKAAVRRTPRLMIPVASIAMLEYFLIDCGATKYLQYISSLTWSTWPYVTRFPTFGHFISEVLELTYLIPNAIPQITYNYCTGVLWTIAVQLQGTWLILCGVVVVYEIKTPWKRMLYYAFCVINHWYARSWGSYLWVGLLLTDLDVTYKYKDYLYARPVAYYPLIVFLWLCVMAGFSANLIPNWITFNFSAYENDIHPDAVTGEPIWNTSDAGYPQYYIPRLNGLLFAAGMQAIVELSPMVQWFLSLPFLLVLFPHIFTIYLLHGLVFWSWGSWLMVSLAERDFTYGVNVSIVGITSYAMLFAILPIVTPIVEALGKDITALVWMNATEKSPPRRRTLFPFPENFLKKRGTEDDVEAGSAGLWLSSGKAMLGDKVQTKEKTLETNEIAADGHSGSSIGIKSS